MAELKYVDWDGLVYYDGKVKDFINDKFGDVLKVGGMVKFEDLPCPSFENLNYLYKISNDFTSNDYFYKPGYRYESGTIVQVSNLNNVYLYTIFSEVDNVKPGIPDIPEDFSEIVEKLDDLDSSVATNTQSITNLEEIQESIDTRMDAVESITEEVKASVDSIVTSQDQINDSLTNIDAKMTALADNVSFLDEEIDNLVEQIVTKDSLDNYYTKDQLDTKLNQIDNSIESMNTTKADKSYVDNQFVTKEELEERIDSIEHPTIDLTDYATKSWVSEQSFLTEHQDLSEYVKKNDIPDMSMFVTNEYVTNVTEQISNEVAQITQNLQENYVTTTQVTEIVTNEVTTAVEEKIETKVVEVVEQKIESGEVVVATNSITYGEF